jgi:hypothetical protein
MKADRDEKKEAKRAERGSRLPWRHEDGDADTGPPDDGEQ